MSEAQQTDTQLPQIIVIILKGPKKPQYPY